MNRIHKIKSPFTCQGCISQEGMVAYMAGNFTRDELQELKRHIQTCKICSEALEGAANFNSGTQYRNGLAQLSSKWAKKNSFKLHISKSTLYGIMSIAASLLLILSIYFLFTQQKNLRSSQIADILLQGELLGETKGKNIELLIPPINQIRNASDEIDDETRENYLQNNQLEGKQEIPLAVMEETRIYADTKTNSEKGENADLEEVNNRSSLRYPFRAMSMPPPDLGPQQSFRPEPELCFHFVEEMPRFKDGDANTFGKYLYKELKYPSKALARNIGGRVYVQFTINKQGQIKEASILKSAHSMLNNAVLELVLNSPDWSPGLQAGKPVSVSMIMPVDFRLNK